MMGQIVDFLRRAFLKRMARNTGASMVGRALPFGVGAVVGGVGNHILGRQIVKAAREAFGPPPVAFDASLAPIVNEARRSLGDRIQDARRIEREGLGGGLRRFRERRGAASEGGHDDAPPAP
jgi:hypothetical protein